VIPGAASRLWAGWIPVLALAGCTVFSEPHETETLTVLAASSLTETFAEMAVAFERGQPHVEVRASFAGSQSLRLQIEQGARADVFASANPEHVRALVETGLVGRPEGFATNALVIAVPPENPSRIESFETLPQAARIVMASPEVPVGRYARRFIARADSLMGGGFEEKVMSRVVSQEPNVRLVLAKVELGEADAAIVYRTDITSARRALSVPIPEELNVEAEYRSAILTEAPNPVLAERWVAFLSSPEARAILERNGFGLP
jgi:molybdate transport system substrate-binding protein